MKNTYEHVIDNPSHHMPKYSSNLSGCITKMNPHSRTKTWPSNTSPRVSKWTLRMHRVGTFLAEPTWLARSITRLTRPINRPSTTTAATLPSGAPSVFCISRSTSSKMPSMPTLALSVSTPYSLILEVYITTRFQTLLMPMYGLVNLTLIIP